MTPQDLRIIGLKYDAAGMVVLGGPAVLSEVSAQSGTYWGHNLPLARALSTARVQSTPVRSGSSRVRAARAARSIGAMVCETSRPRRGRRQGSAARDDAAAILAVARRSGNAAAQRHASSPWSIYHHLKSQHPPSDLSTDAPALTTRGRQGQFFRSSRPSNLPTEQGVRYPTVD